MTEAVTKVGKGRMEHVPQNLHAQVNKETHNEVQAAVEVNEEVKVESKAAKNAQINITEEVNDVAQPAKEIQPVTNNVAETTEKEEGNYNEVQIKKNKDETKDPKTGKKLSKIEGVNMNRQAQLPESRQC